MLNAQLAASSIQVMTSAKSIYRYRACTEIILKRSTKNGTWLDNNPWVYYVLQGYIAQLLVNFLDFSKQWSTHLMR